MATPAIEAKGNIFFSTIVDPLIKNYSTQTQTAIREGIRPHRLACEEDLKGQACSEVFSIECEESGLFPAIRSLMERCPQGKAHALNAIIWSTGISLGLLSTKSRAGLCDCVPPLSESTSDPTRPCD